MYKEIVSKQDRVVNSSGLEKIYTLRDGRTGIQKSDLYSEVGLAKKCILYPNFWSTSLNILEKLIRKAKNLKKAIGTGFMLFKYPSLAYFSLWMLKIENINLHPKSYNFSESFDTFWELQTTCLWIKLNFKESCNARHDAKKQWFTERYKLILENWAVVTSKNLRRPALQTQPQNKNSFVLSIHTSFQN